MCTRRRQHLPYSPVGWPGLHRREAPGPCRATAPSHTDFLDCLHFLCHVWVVPWCLEQEEPPPEDWVMSCLSWQGLDLKGYRAHLGAGPGTSLCGGAHSRLTPGEGGTAVATPRQHQGWLDPSSKQSWTDSVSSSGNCGCHPRRGWKQKALSPRPPSASHASTLRGLGHAHTHVFTHTDAEALKCVLSSF